MDHIRILNLIEPYVELHPDSPAIIDPEGNMLNYTVLYDTVFSLASCLSSHGIKKNQRIAAAMDSKMEIAVLYLAVSSIASFVPLDADFSVENFRYYLKLLKVDCLILSENYQGPLLVLAAKMNLKTFYLKRNKMNQQISYEFSAQYGRENKRPLIFAQDHDIAVVNYTSGTTTEPKIVPRSHINEYSYAMQSVANLQLSESDKVLIMIPMFRGAALNMMLASLASGGTVICTEKISADLIFQKIDEYSVTWFFSIPSILKSLTDFALKKEMQIKSHIRFINSGGAVLTGDLHQKVQEVFNAPVFDAYGLTEAGWIGYNKFSPKGIKNGSLGVPNFVDLAIMDEHGRTQGGNINGEIVVRGPQVIKAYDNGDKVNEESFYAEWFRTGDCGYVDDDGYLFITGRIKEIINRGGEKISPYEIEAVLCQHPDVLQAAVFPIPALNGNEDVGAALVLKPGSKMYLKDMRRFLYGKVITFKIPTALYVLAEIPVGEANKVQRKTLFESIQALGITHQPEADDNEIIIAPRNAMEASLFDLFLKLLPVKKFSVTDTFFELGGDSLRAAILFEEIKKRYKIQVPLKYIFKHSSIEELARYISNNNGTCKIYPFAVPFQEEGQKTPIFFVHALEGEAVVFRHIANNFDPNRPFYAFNFNHAATHWQHPISFKQIAEYYIKDMTAIQSEGPYIIAGQCIGGIIAYEMGQQLQNKGCEIAMLAMYDPIILWKAASQTMNERIARKTEEFKNNGIKMVTAYLKRKNYEFRSELLRVFYVKGNKRIKRAAFKLMDKETILKIALAEYEVNEYKGEVIYFKPENNIRDISEKSIEFWRNYINALKIIPIRGRHLSVFYEENAENTRKVLENILADI